MYVVVVAMLVLMVAGCHVPLKLFLESSGNFGAVEFCHSGPMESNSATNVGVTRIFLATLALCCPDSGSKVYSEAPASTVLILSGVQVPLIPLVETDGSTVGVEFWQNGPIGSNVGMDKVFTTMLIVLTDAHWLVFGVKVYRVVVATLVLMVAGSQVPDILFLEVVANVGAAEFSQSSPIRSNIGSVNGVITMSLVTVIPP